MTTYEWKIGLDDHLWVKYWSWLFRLQINNVNFLLYIRCHWRRNYVLKLQLRIEAEIWNCSTFRTLDATASGPRCQIRHWTAKPLDCEYNLNSDYGSGMGAELWERYEHWTYTYQVCMIPHRKKQKLDYSEAIDCWYLFGSPGIQGDDRHWNVSSRTFMLPNNSSWHHLWLSSCDCEACSTARVRASYHHLFQAWSIVLDNFGEDIWYGQYWQLCIYGWLYVVYGLLAWS